MWRAADRRKQGSRLARMRRDSLRHRLAALQRRRVFPERKSRSQRDSHVTQGRVPSRISREECAVERRVRLKLISWNYSGPWAGITACAALTLLAWYLLRLPYPPSAVENGHRPLGVALLTLLLGLALRNFVPAMALPRRRFHGEETIARGYRPAGSRLDFYDLKGVGFRVLTATVLFIIVILLPTQSLSRYFKVGSEQALLIGVGTAICGSSTIVVYHDAVFLR